MALKPPANRNYAAVLTALPALEPLAGLDNLLSARILGTQVLVSKDHTEGELGVYFPCECALAPELLRLNNLYRESTLNSEANAPRGYFEAHGRVRALRLRGHRSEGLWLPIGCLLALGVDTTALRLGDEFDELEGQPICSKYVPRRNPARLAHNQHKARKPRLEDRIVPEQFRLHYDTENLRRNAHVLMPQDWLAITEKWHGTSVVVSNCLVRRQLPWYERALAWLGVEVQRVEYGIVWSSRRVVKGIDGKPKENAQHYYGADVWAWAAYMMAGKLPPGFTVYGELVGWSGIGEAAKPLQPGYTYGLTKGYQELRVYRVTYTAADGSVVEMPYLQMLDWCARRELLPVKHLWYGQAQSLVPALPDESHNEWAAQLLAELERCYIHNRECPHNPGVPEEGIVVRRDSSVAQSEAWKLKNFAFLEWETKQLDKGEVDVETQQSEGDAI